MKLGSQEVSDKVFLVDYKPELIHQVVTACLANSCADTKAQKSRSDVRGGGAKPYRQKGTGRARAGTRSSPIWRGGGVTFGSSRANHQQKINCKMYQSALRSIFSELVRTDRLKVVEAIELKEPKTKLLNAYLTEQKLAKDLLIICSQENITLFLAARNLVDIACIFVNEVNPLNLIAYEYVLIDQDSLEFLNQSLS